MPDLRPIKLTIWRKFLEMIGCKYYRTKGDHEVWGRKDLYRPVVFPCKGKEITQSIIRSNLKTLGITADDFLSMIEKL